MSTTNLLDFIAASAAPLDEESLSAMLDEVECLPCYSFWDRVSARGDTITNPVAWMDVEHEGATYVLIQLPDDSLIGLPTRNDGERAFWRGTLGIPQAHAPDTAVEPDYAYTCDHCGAGYDEDNDYDLCSACEAEGEDE